jgi:hypothetical protein
MNPKIHVYKPYLENIVKLRFKDLRRTKAPNIHEIGGNYALAFSLNSSMYLDSGILKCSQYSIDGGGEAWNFIGPASLLNLHTFCIFASCNKFSCFFLLEFVVVELCYNNSIY